MSLPEHQQKKPLISPIFSPPPSPASPPSPSWRRVPELARHTTLTVRLSSLLIKWLLYIVLIPGVLSGGVVGASLELGSSWGEAFHNVSLVGRTTLETYQTHLELINISARVLLRLEGEPHASDLDMIAYAAEVRSKTSELSASIDKSLADYLKKQVEQAKRDDSQASQTPQAPQRAPVTLKSVLKASALGALFPLMLYWLISYALTRWWLTQRDRETVKLYLNSP
jgi:hypothetical protein